MHELSICQALIGQVEKVARENHAQRVVSIVIAVGPLSGVEPGLLERAHTGVLFFDEVADMPAGTQSKILRVLVDEDRRNGEEGDEEDDEHEVSHGVNW